MKYAIVSRTIVRIFSSFNIFQVPISREVILCLFEHVIYGKISALKRLSGLSHILKYLFMIKKIRPKAVAVVW